MAKRKKNVVTEAHIICGSCGSVLRPDRKICPICHADFELERKFNKPKK